MKIPASTEIFFVAIFLATISLFSVALKGEGISSFQQTFFRFLIATSILAIIFIVTKSELIRKKDIPKFLLLGFLLNILYLAYLSALFIGVPIVEAVFLVNLQPIFIIVLSIFLFKEKIKKLRMFAAGVAIVGAILLIQLWNTNLLQAPIIGYILAIINAFAYASYILTNKYVRKSTDYGNVTTITFTFLFGFLWTLLTTFILILFNIGESLTRFDFNMTQRGWYLILGIATISTLLPYFLLNNCVKKIPPTRISIILLLEPIIASVFGILIFMEKVNMIQTIGIGLILLAVIVSERSNEK